MRSDRPCKCHEVLSSYKRSLPIGERGVELKHVRTDLESDNAANTLRLGSQQVRSFAEHSFGDIGSWARVVTGQPNAF